MKKKAIVLMLMLPVFSVLLFSQDSSPFQEIIEQALVINLDAKTLTNEKDVSWSMQTDFITLPGKQIKVTLNGNNLDIVAYLTPYFQEQGTILLIAQGEMWITNSETNERQYYSAMKNATFEFGEKVSYFPLGYGEELSSDTTIELEIQIFRYIDYMGQLTIQSTDSLPNTE